MTCSTEIIAAFNEESSGSISFAVTGLDDEALTPNTFSWTLTDVDKVVINSRNNVVGTPSAKNWVDLEGDDLAIPGSSNIRIITAKGTMDTIRDGVPLTNKPYTIEKRFEICRMINIPSAP